MINTFKITLLLFSITWIHACKPKGCTDPKAKNFSYEAKQDDGSCNYGGCTDENALNYNPDAKENDGSCKYNGGVIITSTRSKIDSLNTFLSIEINQQYIGKISTTCHQPFQDCNTQCSHVNFTNQTEGTYTLTFYEIMWASATQIDTLFTSQPKAITIIGGECNLISID